MGENTCMFYSPAFFPLLSEFASLFFPSKNVKVCVNFFEIAVRKSFKIHNPKTLLSCGSSQTPVDPCEPLQTPADPYRSQQTLVTRESLPSPLFPSPFSDVITNVLLVNTNADFVAV
jgi:hypothetical protein